MQIKSRTAGALAVLALLLAFAALSRWYGPMRTMPVLDSKRATIKVIATTDSGPGSLREALFAADTAPAAASILIEVDHIVLEVRCRRSSTHMGYRSRDLRPASISMRMAYRPPRSSSTSTPTRLPSRAWRYGIVQE